MILVLSLWFSVGWAETLVSPESVLEAPIEQRVTQFRAGKFPEVEYIEGCS